MRAGVRTVGTLLFALLASPPTAHAAGAVPVAEAKNMTIIGHSDLNGYGKGGEGLALKQYPDGRRILFLAHESGPICVSVIDVTTPEKPTVVTQLPVEEKYVRCNSLGLAGDTLVVAHQTDSVGEPHAGLVVYDIADPKHPAQLSYFDTSGPHSRGAHFVWFVDGHYAYVSTGAKDFTPKNPNDDQFLMIVDLSNPRQPREVGRWWMPGTREGDEEPPPPRVTPLDTGIRMHSVVVLPERPDRAYIGWIDGGDVILDISDKAHPKLVASRSWQSFGNGFAHTLLPLFSRHLLLQTEEATENNCKDWPKRVWVLDDSNERAPYPLAVLPPPHDQAALCRAGGRSGAHNIHMNRPIATSRTLTHTVVGAFFNAGIRAYSIADPYHPVEIGYIIPTGPMANETGTIQMNDVYVDEKGLIYANDRLSGGLYIIKYTGKVPLN